MLDEVPTRSKVLGGLAAVLLLAAGGNLLYLAMADGGPSLEERQEAVRGQTNLLSCSACGASFEMPADEYLALADRRSDEGSEGVPCLRCGAAKAIKKDVVAQNAAPPAELAGRVDSLTVSEVQAFMKSVQKKQQAVQARATGAPDSNTVWAGIPMRCTGGPRRREPRQSALTGRSRRFAMAAAIGKLIERPWKIISIGMRKWAHGF